MSDIIKKLLKNKKVVILLAIAFCMYALSFISTEKTEKQEENVSITYIDERKLEKILSNVKGAGEVMVYITYENSGVRNIAYDYKNSEKASEVQVKTVGKSSMEEPYVLSNTNPVIAGIFVTATGADSEEMKGLLKKYIKAATNVSLNKIEVAQGEK